MPLRDQAQPGVLYFAYGSNLSRTRMAGRCPASRPLWRAWAPGWALRFERVATIVPAPSACVPGAVYRLTEACEAALDRIEGIHEGRYRRHSLTAVDAHGRPMPALTYVKIDARRGPPVPAYLGHIEAGYRDWTLEVWALSQAVSAADAAEPSSTDGGGTL
ncbi:gamma-glutamylcyclotransferase [Roseospira navarrensis]|uniref:gamma-glutamylcyclotransferase n=1 Tax=Roseospira navarrensis TaxID=140058 RepID=UPI0014781B5F